MLYLLIYIVHGQEPGAAATRCVQMDLMAYAQRTQDDEAGASGPGV